MSKITIVYSSSSQYFFRTESEICFDISDQNFFIVIVRDLGNKIENRRIN